MKLGSSGYFVANGEVIGQYHFSFHDCRFHWGLFSGIDAHYRTEEEVIKEAERSGWEIVPPDKVEVTYKLKGGT